MARGRLAPRTVITTEAKQQKATDARPRWVMVTLSKDDLDRLTARRDAFNEGRPWGQGPGNRIPTDDVASRLLAWALEHAPEPLP